MIAGVVGLGRMGSAIAQRMVQAGITVWGYDIDDLARQKAAELGVQVADKLADIAREARVIMIMVPAGEQTERVIDDLRAHLKAGDVIIDGGNSNFHDSIRRARTLKECGIIFLDCGVSGGLQGRARGFCLMVGGDDVAYQKAHQVFAAIAAPGAVAHVGTSGAGHYVKMVHNGIEYALLEAYGEGFHLLKDGFFKDESLDLEEISRIWNTSALIRSLLLELAHKIFVRDQELHHVSGEIAEGGTGRWTVEEAEDSDIPVPAIKASLEMRQWSRVTGGNYGTKVIAMLRQQFGGHSVKKADNVDEDN